MKKVRRIPGKVGYDDEEASLPDDIPAMNQPGKQASAPGLLYVYLMRPFADS